MNSTDTETKKNNFTTPVVSFDNKNILKSRFC